HVATGRLEARHHGKRRSPRGALHDHPGRRWLRLEIRRTARRRRSHGIQPHMICSWCMRRTTFMGIAAALALSANAYAQTDDEKATARALGQEGQAALDKGDAKTAEDRFHRAVMIFDSAKAVVPPTLILGYARGAALNKHFIAAEEAYNRM